MRALFGRVAPLLLCALVFALSPSDMRFFADLKFIGEYYKPDLIMIPIGGHHVLGPKEAAYVTREMLKPRYAVPMHYGTTPVLVGTPKEYMDALGTTATKVYPLNPGDKLEF